MEKTDPLKNSYTKRFIIGMMTALISSFFAFTFHEQYPLIGRRVGNTINIFFRVFIAVIMYTTHRYKGIGILVAISVMGMIVEFIGVKTCFPYGCFGYNHNMGILIDNTIPLMIFFVRSPLVVGTCALSQKLTQKLTYRIILSTLLLVRFDFILDPGAVLLDMWIYENPGRYYGIPRTNFGGRIISGIIGTSTYHLSIHNSKQAHLLTIPLIWGVFFWTGIALRAQMHILIILGCLLSLSIFIYHQTYKLDFFKTHIPKR